MIRFIREAEVKRLIDEPHAYRLAERVFRLMAQGRHRMPPKIYLQLPGGNDFRAMPAYLDQGKGVCGIKWVSVFPSNRVVGKPTVIGTILLNSAVTGESLAVVQANTITALRTAAAAAVATDRLANPGAQCLAIVGAGTQAVYQLAALTSRRRYREIRVWGLKGEADRFCRTMRHLHRSLRPSKTVEECVRGADVIVTCTPSRRPLVMKHWVKKGAHINAIGADARGKQELETALIQAAAVVVDEWEQASHSGEINVPFWKKAFARRDLRAELSDVVSGRRQGRRSAGEITIFDSTGVAALDVAFAQAVYEARGRRRAP